MLFVSVHLLYYFIQETIVQVNVINFKAEKVRQ